MRRIIPILALCTTTLTAVSWAETGVEDGVLSQCTPDKEWSYKGFTIELSGAPGFCLVTHGWSGEPEKKTDIFTEVVDGRATVSFQFERSETVLTVTLTQLAGGGLHITRHNSRTDVTHSGRME